MDYIGNKLDQGPMVGVVFRAAGFPVFQCLFALPNFDAIFAALTMGTPIVYIR